MLAPAIPCGENIFMFGTLSEKKNLAGPLAVDE